MRSWNKIIPIALLVTACGGSGGGGGGGNPTPSPTPTPGASPNGNGGNPSADLGAKVPLQPLTGITKVTVGSRMACGLTSGGAVYCWGSDDGSGSAYQKEGEPAEIALNALQCKGPHKCVAFKTPGLESGIQDIVATKRSMCALTSGGGVKCWGRNDLHQLGDGTFNDSSLPISVPGLDSGVSSIAKVSETMCAVRSGALVCWGTNESARWVNPTPAAISGFESGVTSIYGGSAPHICATISGTVKCTGAVTDSRDTYSATFAPSINASDVSQIYTGWYKDCAVLKDGNTKCWSATSDGSTLSVADTSIPVSSGLSGLAIEGNINCALTSGAVQCWSRISDSNWAGTLGSGDFSDRTTPGNVVGLSSGVTQIAQGGDQVCAVVGGGVKCWGEVDLTDSSYVEHNTSAVPIDVLTPKNL